MADILVRGIDDEIAMRLKQQAKKAERSLNDLVKDILSEASGVPRSQLVAEIRGLRKKMGRMPDNSVDLIREDRDTL